MSAENTANQERHVFDQEGDFNAFYAAQAWCDENGISYGSMQRNDPIGLMRGNYFISKWRYIEKKERDELDGTMTGDMRNGPVIITLKARES